MGAYQRAVKNRHLNIPLKATRLLCISSKNVYYIMHLLMVSQVELIEQKYT